MEVLDVKEYRRRGRISVIVQERMERGGGWYIVVLSCYNIGY